MLIAAAHPNRCRLLAGLRRAGGARTFVLSGTARDVMIPARAEAFAFANRTELSLSPLLLQL